MPPQTSEQARWFMDEVQPHEPKLRAWLRAKFPTLTDVDDLVQESYSRLLRAQEAGRVLNPKAYLFATARNAALDFLRWRKAAPMECWEETAHSVIVEERPDVTDELIQAQELAWLAEAIQDLPERCRHVLVLQKMHGLSYKEIAARLGISERTVNAQIAKGVLRCRDFVRAQRRKEGQP